MARTPLHPTTLYKKNRRGHWRVSRARCATASKERCSIYCNLPAAGVRCSGLAFALILSNFSQIEKAVAISSAPRRADWHHPSSHRAFRRQSGTCIDSTLHAGITPGASWARLRERPFFSVKRLTVDSESSFSFQDGRWSTHRPTDHCGPLSCPLLRYVQSEACNAYSSMFLEAARPHFVAANPSFQPHGLRTASGRNTSPTTTIASSAVTPNGEVLR